jgi:xylulokinase
MRSTSWHLEAAILRRGFSLRWLRDNVFSGMDISRLRIWPREPPGGRALLPPHLAGERTPHGPAATGALIGLTLRHTRAHTGPAVMEGVVRNAAGPGTDARASAPGERIVVLRRRNWPIRCGCSFSGSFTTARSTAPEQSKQRRRRSALAGVGTGVYRDMQDACAQPSPGMMA